MDSFSLYVHLPYCVKKCPYCDFNSYEFDLDKGFGEEAYLGALIKELEYYSSKPDHFSGNLTSIFFGGGTPSLFKPESIGQIISSAKALFPQSIDLDRDIEITLEANPGSIKEPSSIDKLSWIQKQWR